MQMLILTRGEIEIVWNVFVSGAGNWQRAYQRQIGHTWVLKGAWARDCDQVSGWMWPLVDLSDVHCTFIPSSLHQMLYLTVTTLRGKSYYRQPFQFFSLVIKKKMTAVKDKTGQRSRLWNPMLINCWVFDFARHTGLYWFSFLSVCMCWCEWVW